MTLIVFCLGLIAIAGWFLYFMERRKRVAVQSTAWMITSWWMAAQDRLDAIELETLVQQAESVWRKTGSAG